MNFVDEEDRSRILPDLGDHGFQALFEIASIFSTGDERPHVERIDRAVTQHFRHTLLCDQSRQTFCDSRLPDARLADVERVVFSSPAKYLNRPFDFEFAADQRIDFAVDCQLIEVCGVFLQSAGVGFSIRIERGIDVFLDTLTGQLRHAMCDVIHDIESCDVLKPQEVHGLRLFLAENRHQYVAAGDFLLAAGLYVEDRALQHALEAERGLDIALFSIEHQWCRLVDEFG